MKLVVDDITFGYDERNVLEGLSFTYESPDAFCILGSNGTGKSTLLQCIMGEYHVKAGSISIDGKPVSEYSARELARKVAYIPQTHVPTFAYPVIDVVTMGRTSRMGYLANPSSDDRAVAEEQLEYLGITKLRNKPYTDISGGERQLVMIASALAQEPELLLLDEPTAHLDFGNQFKFVELVEKLRDRGMGVLMTTHFPDHALQLGGTCAVMRSGHVETLGPAADVVTSTSMTSLYGIDVSLLHVGKRTVCVPGAVDDEPVLALERA